MAETHVHGDGYVLGVPGRFANVSVQVDEAGNVSIQPFSAITVTGKDDNGNVQTETINLQAGETSYSTNVYASVGIPDEEEEVVQPPAQIVMGG